MRNLIFILGDQLSPDISSLDGADPALDGILICEVLEEASYVRHHKRKIAFIFSAMRHFGRELEAKGFHVRYVRLDDPGNSGSFTGELLRAVQILDPERVRVTEAGEWRVMQMIDSWSSRSGLAVDVLADHRFLCSHAEFRAWAASRPELRMEFFYRDMRRKTGLLMRGAEPEGRRWNYDLENRKLASSDLFQPRHLHVEPDEITREVLDLVEVRFAGHIGSLKNFGFAVTRADAEAAARLFIAEFLPDFGVKQDAMVSADPFLNHSLLSFYINIGFLDPLDVCRAAERAYHEGRAPLNSVEGFIRQIIGWREYMRGVYWLRMPDLATANFLQATRPLPQFYWTGKTDMNCLAIAIGDTIRHAYAHHIQRLMVTGNFALIAGIDPREVHQWYLEVYADAYEWVEMPNVIGMSQFADGGFLGSKPYAASGSYIAHMSDYCTDCRYNPKKKTGPGACPFNVLYWDFIGRNEDKLKTVPRLEPVLAAWQRMPAERQAEYRENARVFLEALS
ncbi:cryptochrome/photolyase family protein [Rhizobium deserti]|uniref:Cryptochrome/photolyase family protein n=1 Tax=Rhizobium deserti TaxID=2547961 RepID=A0A4R5UPC0_9HYPH|nr:cryptochrome/photolyase family protein [Rhizobium deserti]TDK39771.1 cryptochrome/photolyase family protein [Rhizobium deserti]